MIEPQQQLGEGKGVLQLTALRSRSIMEAHQDRRSRQELKQKSWRHAVYRLAPLGSLSLLSYTTEYHLSGGSATHSELDPPTQITSQDNTPQMCLQASLMEAFAQLKFPLPGSF